MCFLKAELLVANPAVKSAIGAEGKPNQLQNAMQMGKDYGMVTMEESLKRLLLQGTISQESYQLSLRQLLANGEISQEHYQLIIQQERKLPST